MNNVNMGFILTILAGLSTMLGTIFIFIKKRSDNIIIGSLSFASGVMLAVSITDLIPESYSLLINLFPKFPAIIYMLIFVVSGILLIATFAAVAPYIATTTQLAGIHFADEFLSPSSVIFTEVS